MLGIATSRWWVLLIRGIVALLFGILAFVFPTAALVAMVFVFGAYAFIDGVLALVTAFSSRSARGMWGWLLIEGIAGILAGIFAWIWPGMTAYALIYLAAAWAIVTGIFEIVAAVSFRKEIPNEWVLAVAGIASIILGIVLMFLPTVGIYAAVFVIAAYAVVFGILMIVLAVRLNSLRTHRPTPTPSGPQAHPV